MAEPDNNTHSSSDANASSADGLPHVPSPSISPADDAHRETAVDEPVPSSNALTLFIERTREEKKNPPRFAWPQFVWPTFVFPKFVMPDFAFAVPHISLSRRMKRRGLMAASIAVAALCGGFAGAFATHGLSEPPKVDTAAIEEAQAMHKSIAHLTKEVTTLKASLEAASKQATSQIGKVTDRVEKIERAPDTTGSIGKTASTPALPPSPATPLPPSRPPQILSGWTAHEARDGTILVENRGELYEVTAGIPLPGIGPIESIKRDNGRIIVATAKGLIVSDPAERMARQRSYYPPPFMRPF